MFIDPSVYNYDYLKDEDKNKVDLIEFTKRQIISSQIIDDYLELQHLPSETLTKIQEDLLTHFVSYLHERAELLKVDVIIEAIDNYSQEDFEKLKNAATKCVVGIG